MIFEFLNGSRPPSWICFTSAFDHPRRVLGCLCRYGIGNVVMKIWVSMLCAFAWKCRVWVKIKKTKLFVVLLANVNSCSGSLYAIAVPSVVCLSVTFVHPTQPVEIFGNLISDIWNAVTTKRCKIGGNLALMTNRKSYISFRSVPKSVTLNDLERGKGPYLALFYRIW